MITHVRDYTLVFKRNVDLVTRNQYDDLNEMLIIRMKSVEQWTDDGHGCIHKSFDEDKERARAACCAHDMKAFEAGEGNFAKRPRPMDYALNDIIRGHPVFTRVECADSAQVPKETP